MTTLAAAMATQSRTAAHGARWFVLIGAVLVQLILGTVYGYSVFWQPLETHLWPPVMTAAQAEEAHVQAGVYPVGAVVVNDAAEAAQVREQRTGHLKYAFALCLFSFATAMVFAGRVQDVKGPRFTAAIGGGVLGLGFLIAGQMDYEVTFYICHALLMGSAVVVALLFFDALFKGVDRDAYPVLRYVPHGIVTVAVVVGMALADKYVSNTTYDRVALLWATIGLLAGVGIGYAYVCPIAALVKWFPQHKGLVSGIAVAGFGAGAAVFSSKAIGAVGFIERHGITAFFTIHGIISLVVVILAAMLLRNPPQAATPAPASRSSMAPVDATWRQLLRQGRFYLIWCMFFSGAMAGLMVIGILKPFAGHQLVRAAEAGGTVITEAIRADLLLRGATAVGVLALFNAAGRVVWGFLSDLIGRPIAMALMFVFQGVTLLCLSALQSETQLVIGAACVGFNFGGNFALFPSLTADAFGSKNFGANYGWVFTSYGVAGLMGVWAGNLAQQVTGSYFAAFAAAAVLCFISAALALALRKPARPVAA